MSHQQDSQQPDAPAIRLFVYGTLKRGCCNHETYCGSAVSIEPATVWGRLHQLSSGLLVLEIPEEDILAVGTNDPLADALTQQSVEVPAPGSRQCAGQRSIARCTAGSECIGDGPEYSETSDCMSSSSPWKSIAGELITFDDPMRSFPPIDRLEGFSPNGTSLYRRVLAATEQLTGHIVPAWIYVL